MRRVGSVKQSRTAVSTPLRHRNERTSGAGREAQRATAESTPSPEEIARLAYFYWESRGENGGSAEEDWLRAERELQQATISHQDSGQ